MGDICPNFAGRALLAALAIAGLAGPARAACLVDAVTFCDGCVAQRRMIVDKGSVCYLSNNMGGGGALEGVDILEKGKLGQFGLASRTQSAYRAGPKPGADRFVFRVRWEQGGRHNAVTIVNNVTIRP